MFLLFLFEDTRACSGHWTNKPLLLMILAAMKVHNEGRWKVYNLIDEQEFSASCSNLLLSWPQTEVCIILCDLFQVYFSPIFSPFGKSTDICLVFPCHCWLHCWPEQAVKSSVPLLLCTVRSKRGVSSQTGATLRGHGGSRRSPQDPAIPSAGIWLTSRGHDCRDKDTIPHWLPTHHQDHMYSLEQAAKQEVVGKSLSGWELPLCATHTCSFVCKRWSS